MDFKERKTQLNEDFTDKLFDYFDTPKKRNIGIGVALTALALFIWKPKAILPTVVVAGSILPSLALSSGERNECFGITQNGPLEIYIPRPDDASIQKDEIKLRELKSEVEKRKDTKQ